MAAGGAGTAHLRAAGGAVGKAHAQRRAAARAAAANAARAHQHVDQPGDDVADQRQKPPHGGQEIAAAGVAEHPHGKQQREGGVEDERGGDGLHRAGVQLHSLFVHGAQGVVVQIEGYQRAAGERARERAHIGAQFARPGKLFVLPADVGLRRGDFFLADGGGLFLAVASVGHAGVELFVEGGEAVHIGGSGHAAGLERRGAIAVVGDESGDGLAVLIQQQTEPSVSCADSRVIPSGLHGQIYGALVAREHHIKRRHVPAGQRTRLGEDGAVFIDKHGVEVLVGPALPEAVGRKIEILHRRRAAGVGCDREVVQKFPQRVVAGKRLPVGVVAIHAHGPQAQREREQHDEQYGEYVYLLTHVPLSLP